MRTALFCPGWPRGLDAAVRTVTGTGGEPVLFMLPSRAVNVPGPGTPVVGLDPDEVATGILSPATRTAARAAGVRRLVVFRNDGGELEEAVAVRAAIAVAARELQLYDGPRPAGRYRRHQILLAAARLLRPAPRTRADRSPAPAAELFDPVAGRALSHDAVATGVDASGRLSVTGLGFLEIPGMAPVENLEPTTRRRIVMLGGSALYGLGLAGNGETIPARLHAALSAHEPDVEVLSFATPGAWSRGESALLLYRLVHTRPDVVVSLSGWNDFNTAFATELVYGPGAEVVNWTFSDYHHYLRVHAPYEITATDVPFAERGYVRRHFTMLDSAVFPDSGPGIRRRTWRENQRLMAETCTRHGIRFVAALQPHSLLQPALGDDFTRAWVRRHYDFAFAPREALFERYVSAVTQAYDGFREDLDVLAGLCPEATFDDLSTVFADEDEPCLMDGVHPTAAGALRIAARLRDLIGPAGSPEDHRPRRSSVEHPGRHSA